MSKKLTVVWELFLLRVFHSVHPNDRMVQKIRARLFDTDIPFENTDSPKMWQSRQVGIYTGQVSTMKGIVKGPD